MRQVWRYLQWGLLAMLAASLLACDKASSPGSSQDAAAPDASWPVFRILAGSELKDMVPLLQQFGQQNKVNIQLEYSGTLDAVDQLQEQPDRYDAVWVSHGKYMQLIPEARQLIAQSEKTMYSRVVLGVKPDVAARLGWKSGQVGWRDVIAASEQGKFRFAMSNPTSSNTGFVALVGLATELSGKADALQVSDVPSEQLKALFKGQSLASGSSGLLAEKLASNPAAADGMVNYESVIKGMAARGVPLQVILPKEGVITADYPLMLLKSSKQAATYKALLAWLRSTETQKQIATTTQRTPLVGGDEGDVVVNELPFPGSRAVVDAILRGYLDNYSRPVSTFILFDHSGSMSRDDRIGIARKALLTLVQDDNTVTGRFATLREREQLFLLPFSHVTDPMQSYEMGKAQEANRAVMQQFAQNVDYLQAGGGTAIYDTLIKAYPEALKLAKSGERNVAIILLTDGENADGSEFSDFQQQLQQWGGTKVPVYPILFGESDEGEMSQLASLTGGQTFDARKTPLSKVFKKIRANQ